MKRNNQPMYGETPFVSYTVCVNHVVEKVVISTALNDARERHPRAFFPVKRRFWRRKASDHMLHLDLSELASSQW